MTTHNSTTIHCWRPEAQLLVVGLVLSGGALAAGTFFDVFRALPWATMLKILAGLLLLIYWAAYCRIRVTPWEVQVLSSGLWKGRYNCPLEEAAAGGWLLPEWAAQAGYYSPALTFSTDEDWDTGIPYVEIQFYGDDILNCFREKQYPSMAQALHAMADRRRALEAIPATDSDATHNA